MGAILVPLRKLTRGPLRLARPILIFTNPMSLMEERRAQMYPRLTDAQIARVAALGKRRRVVRDEILFEQRQVHRPFFVVLSGVVNVVQATADGERLFH